MCGAATKTVPADKGSIKGVKYQSSTVNGEDFHGGTVTAGWKCLGFSLDAPQYFMYNYTATIDDKVADNNKFSSIAEGDLNGDDNLSKFERAGIVRNGEIVLSPSIAETNPEE